MPLYYFDIYNRDGFYRDEFGDEFGILEEALTQVHALLPDIARDDPPDPDHPCIACELRDDTGRVVYRGELTYREVDLPS